MSPWPTRSKVKVYMKNFGEFYNNQIEAAGTIILSRTQKLSQEKLEAAAAMLREKNPDAAILTTPWDELDGKTILSAIEKGVAEPTSFLKRCAASTRSRRPSTSMSITMTTMRMSMTTSMGIITTMTMTMHDEHEHHHHHHDARGVRRSRT